jgi:hypothetical protein
MVQVSDLDIGSVAKTGRIRRAFAYVETKEPLQVYKLW